MAISTFNDFCAQVCEHVRFSPDHEAIAAELAAHLEDHAAALMERGVPEEEAARRALEAMGDPEEIGKELDKSHSPLLGGFQELFRALVWTALAVLLMCAIPWVAETVHNIADPPVYDERDTVPLLEQYDKLKLVADYHLAALSLRRRLHPPGQLPAQGRPPQPLAPLAQDRRLDPGGGRPGQRLRLPVAAGGAGRLPGPALYRLWGRHPHHPLRHLLRSADHLHRSGSHPAHPPVRPLWGDPALPHPAPAGR